MTDTCCICHQEVGEYARPLKALLCDSDDKVGLLVLCRRCVEEEGLSERPLSYERLDAIYNRERPH